MSSLKDVALLSGVSISTVSRVLNSPELVDPKTQKIVQEAMKKLNYRPNLVASGLRSKSSKQIALVVPNAVHYTSASMIQHTSRLLQKKGYTLILGNHHNHFETENELLDSYFRRNIDGIILYLIYDESRAVQALLEREERHVPIVVVGRRIHVPTLANVTVDNFKAGLLAAEHLASLGHRRVATVTGPQVAQWARDRLDGFREGLEQHGIKLSWSFAQQDLTDFETGTAAADEFLRLYPDRQKRPTAIWAQNDIMAAGLLKHLNQSGLCVPEDISLLGMDNIELATMITPTLSTIQQPLGEIARESIRIILEDRIPGTESTTLPHVSLEPSLVIRNSTAPPPF